MKVSLNWALHYSNVDLKSIPIDTLVHKIGTQLGAVEEVIHWGPRFEHIVVAKIISCEKHPNADKLQVCRIDDGGAVQDVERGQDGLVQVVCGAPNARSGLTVAWLPPGSVVPSTLDKDPFTLEARDIRGQKSNGMLASPQELGLSDNHDGILEISEAEVGLELTKPGTPFKQLYGLDDVVIDCENKMFTHRPDCFGILGVARELAGITQQAFVSPEWYMHRPSFKAAHDAQFNIEVHSDVVSRFMGVVMQNVSVGPSPMFIQAGLTRVGIRPINNIVDITNWMMQLTGQPMHAYDYDKILARCSKDAYLQARPAQKGETIALLNGKTVTLDESVVVIATDKEAVGIGGVMGGADTEVDETTKNIILEVATFDMYAIRRTSMKLGLFTDAVTRYNKGQSPLQNDRVLAEAMRMVSEFAKGHQASAVIDVADSSVKEMPRVSTTADFINARLGTKLKASEMQTLLENVECVSVAGGTNESRSYIMGVGDIDEKLTRIGVKIVEKSDKGHYKVIIPAGAETEYEKLLSWEMQPGFWNEYIGAKNVFIFKDPSAKVSRYEVSDDTEHEIVEMCRTFSNDYYSSIEAMLALNAWYRPLLPLRKSEGSDAIDPNAVSISPPFWRRDLSIPEDLVEEIGRLHGFDALPVALPKRPSTPAAKNQALELAQRVRMLLASAGANEVLTYSFVHGKLLQAAGQKAEDAYHVRNALSPDLQYYRMSLSPSIAEKIHMNVRAGYEAFALYEIGLPHSKRVVDEDGLPIETPMLALSIARSKTPKDSGAPYYAAQAYVRYMGEKLGVPLQFDPLTEPLDDPTAAAFEPSRSALIRVVGTDAVIGIVGEYTASLRKALKLPAYCSGFELSLADLQMHISAASRYKPLARFPKVQQDVTFEVAGSLSHQQLFEAVKRAAAGHADHHGYVWEITPGDSYAAADSDHKRITFHVVLHHAQRTLTTEESNTFIEALAQEAAQSCAAKRI